MRIVNTTFQNRMRHDNLRTPYTRRLILSTAEDKSRGDGLESPLREPPPSVESSKLSPSSEPLSSWGSSPLALLPLLAASCASRPAKSPDDANEPAPPLFGLRLASEGFRRLDTSASAFTTSVTAMIRSLTENKAMSRACGWANLASGAAARGGRWGQARGRGGPAGGQRRGFH